jgi:hypothetical protein
VPAGALRRHVRPVLLGGVDGLFLKVKPS